jgi:hypothetical protein
MRMDVLNRLPAVRVAIHNHPVPAFGNTHLARETSRRLQHIAQKLRIAHGVERIIMRARYNKNMHRRLRIDIPKGHNALIAVYHVGRYAALRNPAK